jgi:hypothetical protein
MSLPVANARIAAAVEAGGGIEPWESILPNSERVLVNIRPPNSPRRICH